MKIEIYKKENDENIYVNYNDKEKILNFDNLKELSKIFLEKSINNEDTSYSFDCIPELNLYKNTVDDVIKSVIEDDYLKFEELSLKIGLNDLTDKGQLIKKVKDFIIEKVDNVERDINTIRSMDNSGEILVEYLKTKNLSIAIREVNDRHVILEQVQRDYDIEREVKIQEEQAVEKVDEVLQAPVEVQTTIDDFEEPVQTKVELLEAKFKVVTTRENLEYLVKIMKERGIRYEPITE